MIVAAALAALAMLLLSGGDHAATTQEERIAQVLSAMEGAGSVQVALFYADDSVPTGAVIVAQGAGDMAVRLRLIRAARTLLGLPENAVDVFVMEER